MITGNLGLGRIRRSGGALSGAGAARTGLIMGYIEIAIPILCGVGFVALSVIVALRGQ